VTRKSLVPPMEAAGGGVSRKRREGEPTEARPSEDKRLSNKKGLVEAGKNRNNGKEIGGGPDRGSDKRGTNLVER